MQDFVDLPFLELDIYSFSLSDFSVLFTTEMLHVISLAMVFWDGQQRPSGSILSNNALRTDFSFIERLGCSLVTARTSSILV